MLVLLSKPPLETPSKFVMGHEIAGSISAVGDQLANDPYYKKVLDLLLQIVQACGTCDSCRRGLDSVCDLSHQAYGLNEDECYSNFEKLWLSHCCF